MSGAKSWLAAEAARVEQLPCLEDALVGFGARRYAVYRLRYVFVQALLRTLFRLLELVLFASAVPFEILSSVLVLRSGMVLGEGLWWGALETLRRDVRALYRQGRIGQASQRIRQWLALAVVLGLSGLVSGVLWVWLGPSPFRSFSVVDAYLLGCCLRFATDLLVSAYHAGVYGLRRVYRPLWSLLFVDLADVGLLGLAFWWLGVWGVACSLVAVGALRACVVWGFTRRVYQGLKLDVGVPMSWARVFARKAVWSARHSIEHATSNVIGQVDALFVLGLLAAPGAEESTLLLAGLFHVLAPLQAAASAWSRLFYFDFKRLEAWGSPVLLRRFEAFLSYAAWWIPLPIGVLTLALMAAFWRGTYWVLALELTCLAAVRSRLSLVHIRAYSLSDHVFLRRLFFGMLGIAATTPFIAGLPPAGALATVVALMALGLLVLGRSKQPLIGDQPNGLIEPSLWIERLLRVNEPVCIGLARVDRRLSTVGRLARVLREAVSDGVQTRLSNDTVAWFSRQLVQPQHLLTAGAGTVCELQLGALTQSGRNALELGVDGETWQRHLGAVLRSGLDHAFGDVRSLEQVLRAVHPEAQVLELVDTASLPQLDAVTSRALRRLLLDATRGDSSFRTLGTFEVAVLAPGGEALAPIVVPKGSRPAQDWKGEVRTIVHRAHLQWTLSQRLKSS